MKMNTVKKSSWGVGAAGVAVFLGLGLVSQKSKSSIVVQPSLVEINNHGVNKEMISTAIGPAIRGNQFPDHVKMTVEGLNHNLSVQYSIGTRWQAQVEKLLHAYRPDHAAFIAMDAKTGRILAMASYQRDQKSLDNMNLQATFPAASVFKVVTASAAIDSKKASSETVVAFNGANHTLYKHNVDDTRVNRWTRYMTMREAFSRSVNMFFGKLGLFTVGPENLLKYAERFQFNHTIPADIPIDVGHVKISADDPWGVVQAASGFTRDNTMSPLQGALIAAAVANDGVMMAPYLVEQLVDENGAPIYQAEAQQIGTIMDPSTASELRVLMQETVRNGTSRKAFRPVIHKSQFEDVEMGGKTGSLTGLNPAGKCDWFVGYARYNGERVAVAALSVNEKKWRVKSSQLASFFLSDYVRELKAQDRQMASTGAVK
jgi:peptidoglycan glycosyltransferase